MKKIYQTWILPLLPIILLAGNWKINSDYWTATDALGRRTPARSEAGPVRDGKYVAMFYWTWHTDNLAEFSPVMNTSQILREHPEAAGDLNHPAWKGIWGGVFWWEEPLFGYYRTTDDWVLRKHGEMMADAGVDAVFFDCTNGSYTWKSSYTRLLDVWEQARNDGVKTPQVAFLLPFGDTEGALTQLKELYHDLYQPGLHQDLWFMWKGKPIIMAYPEALKAKPGDTASLKFKADSAFVAIDVHCPSWTNNIGTLTFSLYKWDRTQYYTLAGDPAAEKTFENFNDNAWLKLTFKTQQPGDYMWLLHDPVEVVGVWENTNDQPQTASYFNGKVVDGDYESGIFYASGAARKDIVPSTGAHVPVQLGEGTSAELASEIKSFFTFRPGQPDYVSGPHRADHWGWLEVYPQHGYVNYQGFEQVPVGVAQNASDASSGRCYAFNAPGTYGRSFTRANGQDPRPDAYLYGLNFQEQWERAFELDPQLVFVTGWNEWIAGRYQTWGGCTGVPFPNAFPDEYNREKSRDIEPVKAWGNKGDVYYLQLVSNVRRFKGMAQQEPASAEKTIQIGAFNGWKDVKPEYWDYTGDTMHRNHKGQGNELVYTNNSGRNDIRLTKVARDAENLYFYVETAASLSPPTDPNWMQLFIDIDRDKSTGWEGYDFVINRTSPGDSLLIKTSTGGWNWEKAGTAAYAVQDNKLELSVNRSIIGLAQPADFAIEFKWSDNMQEAGNVMDFYVNGDAAPGGRFNYVYRTKSITKIGEIPAGTPQQFSLLQNYPNPFNPQTTIRYTLKEKSHVLLRVFDIRGNEVKTLVNRIVPPGSYQTIFEAAALSSGIYFYRLQTGHWHAVKKMVLLE